MSLYDGIKDVAKVVQQADNIDLYKKLLDLGQQALGLQDEVRQLKEENSLLKAQAGQRKRIVRHKSPYVTLEGEGEDIWYCSTCWGKEGKLIQLAVSGEEAYCFSCQQGFFF